MIPYRLYVAAPRALKFPARSVASYYRSSETVQVVSAWHDLDTDISIDPEDARVRRTVAIDLDSDLMLATHAIALTHAGEPRATFSEIGFMLARRVPIVWMQGVKGEGQNIFDGHPLVRVVHSYTQVRDAFEAIIDRAALLDGIEET